MNTLLLECYVGRLQEAERHHDPKQNNHQPYSKGVALLLRTRNPKAAIRHVDDRQTAIQDAVAKSKRSFMDLLKNPEGYVLDALEQERLAVRPEAETTMRSEIEEKTGAPLQEQLYRDSLEATEKALTVQKKQQLKEQAIKDDKQKKKAGFDKKSVICPPFQKAILNVIPSSTHSGYRSDNLLILLKVLW